MSADRKVRPKKKLTPKDESLIARIDPELDEIRYGGAQHDGKSVADINGLNVHLSSKFQAQFLEDNQATITIITKGDSEKMRHTDRTQRISFGWLKQQFERGLFNMINVGTHEQVADIFTKPFADKIKWHKVLALINHVDCSKQALDSKGGTKASDSHLLHKPHVHGSPAAYTPQQQTHHQQHDRPSAAAANARHEPRSTDCNWILVEFCCEADSKLGQARHASSGCHVVRVTEEQDTTKMSTISKLVRQIHQLCNEGGGSNELLIWASLPCTGGCSWQRINEAINPEKVQRHRDQYLTLFKSLKQVLRLTKRHKPALATELPKSCQYWQYAVVQCLIKDHQLVDTFCDGCMLGVTDQHDIHIRKSWRIACTFPIVSLQDKICDGNHMHGESRGQALKIAESYTFNMTDAIHREFARHVNRRTTKALPVVHLPACCCVARSDPWPIAVNNHLVEPLEDRLRPSTSKMAAASSTQVTGKSGIMLDDVQELTTGRSCSGRQRSPLIRSTWKRHAVVSFKNMLSALYGSTPADCRSLGYGRD